MPEFDETKLKWHMGENLRWLAEQAERPDYMPCGMLTSAFLTTVAEHLELLATRSKTHYPPLSEHPLTTIMEVSGCQSFSAADEMGWPPDTFIVPPGIGEEE